MKLTNGRTSQQHVPAFAFCYLAADYVFLVWERQVHGWKSHFVERKLAMHYCVLSQTNANNLCMLVGVVSRHQETCSGEPEPKQQTWIGRAPVSWSKNHCPSQRQLSQVRNKSWKTRGKWKKLKLWVWGHRGGGTQTSPCACQSVVEICGSAKLSNIEEKSSGFSRRIEGREYFLYASR